MHLTMRLLGSSLHVFRAEGSGRSYRRFTDRHAPSETRQELTITTVRSNGGRPIAAWIRSQARIRASVIADPAISQLLLRPTAGAKY